MANTRIVDLPLASSVDDSVYIAGDTLGGEGTVKMNRQQFVAPLINNAINNQVPTIITSELPNEIISFSSDSTDSNIITGMTLPALFARIQHLLSYIYLTDTELTTLETELGLNESTQSNSLQNALETNLVNSELENTDEEMVETQEMSDEVQTIDNIDNNAETE